MQKMAYIGVLNNIYYLLKKIAEGGTSYVYIGYHKDDLKKLLAIKVNKDDTQDNFFYNERVMLGNFNSPYIVKMIDSGEGFMRKVGGTQTFCKYIVLEYLKHGELFDYLMITPKGFGEKLGRIIFLILLDAVEATHNEGIVHRDLKTENFMISDDFEIKLADFGFATLKEGKEKNGLLDTYLGTEKYAAPEVLANTPYFGVTNDIYSLGVILFLLVTKGYPFEKAAVETDLCYPLIMNCNYEGFWKKRFPNGTSLSESFRFLFQNMIALDFSQRPTMGEIRQHPWAKEGLSNWEENKKILKEEMRKLKITIDQNRVRASLANRMSTLKAGGIGRAYRSGGYAIENSSVSSDTEIELRKHVDTGNLTQVEYGIENEPGLILENVKIFLINNNADVKISDKRCKITAIISSNTQLGLENVAIKEAKISCEVFETEDQTNFILEFNQLSGEKGLLFSLFQEFVDSMNEKSSP
jgi:serine/threonine protein kinase